MKHPPTPRRKTGRPLSFDRDAALEKAMLAFWEHGYETTSISDLTAAMGVTAPSIYTAFGDKKRLFLEAMRRYAGDPADLAAAFASASSARQAVAGMLENAARLYTGDATPRGCLLASATATGSKNAADVRDAVAQERRAIRAIIVRRIERDVAAGRLPPETAPPVLADLALAVTQGMSVLARDGADREALLAVARASMTAWPE
ncbi:TetR/AcrR family transcriptional regulator [Aquisalinus flavus]|uniref:TetR family transcriptional regulator n=1 Tax=Aquisalinus flavus TaxID=1526572 RepID=A0A8J2V626_9PROT|nr:TetR/AcrR family transcriptional regulator [Aquisalinus flavus]MBD0425783.1 TetR/AcrR family transcriptional regulator [Aquisalinus flavus]UNE48610.1 TetR/AcrR family transcriptional regulator [Aquisalinus flavus]GGD13351.1 TetR family transcriptional regulator [Aquisalinus flavus]